MNHVNLDTYDDSVKRFILSLPSDTEGSVLEVGGRPIARVLPFSIIADVGDDWNSVKDSRRCVLIDREIAGVLTPDEVAELGTLQAAMLRHRRRVAPLPLDDARQLYRELLEKALGGTGG